MQRDDMIEKLRDLAQLDTDAVTTYEEALKHVTDQDVKTAFEQFQGEHRYHAEQLVATIERLGAERPTLKVDLAGHLADWVTALRSQRGTEGALHAMQTAERYHNRHYADALDWDVDDAQVAEMLRRFADDEKRHLEFVEERLGHRVTTAGG